MSETVAFMMGEFRAEFPGDRLYADNHMWALPLEGVIRFGFTAYAVRLLQDVYFLDWTFDAPRDVTRRQEIGSIESKKAESALFSPIDGRLVRFNDRLMKDPSAINVDKYDQGWLLEIEGSPASLMSPVEYIQHLDKAWEKTQRTIKGQMNE